MSAVIGADELTVLEEDIENDLISAYISGQKDARKQLGLDDEAFDIDLLDLDHALNLVIDGRTWVERIREGSDIGLVLDTEKHRMYNTGVYDSAKGRQDVWKTWHTMEDDRVRDTHYYIDGMTVPLEANFYTFDGDYGRFPGDFQTAENNCNCRCHITLRQGSL